MSSLEGCAQLWNHYDDYYDGRDDVWRELGAVAKATNVVSLCQPLPHRSIIEIGAGDGSVLQELSGRSFGDDYVALEVSSSGVQKINSRRIPRLRECRLFDGYEIPFDDQFDLAILCHVIEHVEFPRKLIYEAARVAKFVFVEVPLEDTIRLKPDFVLDRVGHINFYSQNSIRRLLQSCQLEVVQQQITNSSGGVYAFHDGRRGLIKHLLKETLLKAAPRLATGMFTYHSALVCRRAAA